jgi:O-antigen ligase
MSHVAGRPPGAYPLPAKGGRIGDVLRPFGLSLPVFAGRSLLLVLLVVIPMFNPALWSFGDERLYLGTVVVVAAAALMLPLLLSGRFNWIVVALVLAAAYVLETGLLRGDLRLGIVGNSYRPIHAVLVFCACAVFLAAADRDRWLGLFLAGGLVGCFLAVLNTAVPAIDPFALSRPEDIPYEARFISSRRQEGAFVYPGNFGPYAAYVAIAALIALERGRPRVPTFALYVPAFVFGALGVFVSGSRAAALGLAVAGLVVAWRSRRLRIPLLASAVVGTVVLVGVLWAAGVLGEIVRSRLLLADVSWELRFLSWRAGWEPFLENPLFGGGVIPNTIDSTLFYYLGVGGLVGLLLVLAMYWTTVLRPLRHRDWSGLPIGLAVVAIGITQDALGQPLATWAIGASVFLVSRPGAEHRPVTELSEHARKDELDGGRRRPSLLSR